MLLVPRGIQLFIHSLIYSMSLYWTGKYLQLFDTCPNPQVVSWNESAWKRNEALGAWRKVVGITTRDSRESIHLCCWTVLLFGYHLNTQGPSKYVHPGFYKKTQTHPRPPSPSHTSSRTPDHLPASTPPWTVLFSPYKDGIAGSLQTLDG